MYILFFILYYIILYRLISFACLLQNHQHDRENAVDHLQHPRQDKQRESSAVLGVVLELSRVEAAAAIAHVVVVHPSHTRPRHEKRGHRQEGEDEGHDAALARPEDHHHPVDKRNEADDDGRESERRSTVHVIPALPAAERGGPLEVVRRAAAVVLETPHRPARLRAVPRPVVPVSAIIVVIVVDAVG